MIKSKLLESLKLMLILYWHRLFIRYKMSQSIAANSKCNSFSAWFNWDVPIRGHLRRFKNTLIMKSFVLGNIMKWLTTCDVYVVWSTIQLLVPSKFNNFSQISLFIEYLNTFSILCFHMKYTTISIIIF